MQVFRYEARLEVTTEATPGRASTAPGRGIWLCREGTCEIKKPILKAAVDVGRERGLR